MTIKKSLKRIITRDVKKIYNLPKEVIFCKNCVMSNQRPRIVFDKEGVCNACRNHELKGKTNWDERKKKLIKLLANFRKNNGDFDVVVPSSGGKDSSVVAHRLKYEFGMNPLTVTWSPNSYTQIGWDNFQGLIDAGLPNVLGTPDGLVNRRFMRDSTIEMGEPFQPFAYGQVNYPAKVALQHGIRLIMDGENGEEEYGGSTKSGNETFDLEEQKKYWFSNFPVSKWLKMGYTKKELNFYNAASPKEYIKNKITRKFWSHYMVWDPQEHYYYVAENTNFKPNPDGRSEQTYSKYASLDDKYDGFHYYFMYLKFGINRCTSDTSHEIREGHLSRQEAVDLVERYDSEFPVKRYKEFLEYCSISTENFKKIEDSWRNRNIWTKAGTNWKLNHTVGKKGLKD